MGKTVRSLQLEPHMPWVAERPQRHVIQAIEPEAERLLLQGGGKVLRDQEGSLYEEYLDSPWPTLVIYWPIQTRLVYLAARGQEDSSYVIFIAALRPGLRGELHLTYEYRLWDPVFGPFEEFFYAAGGPGAHLGLGGKRAMKRHARCNAVIHESGLRHRKQEQRPETSCVPPLPSSTTGKHFARTAF